MGFSALTNVIIVLGIVGTLVWFGAGYKANQAENAYPPLGEFVEVTGGRVHYVQEGSGPHLILLHGAGGNLREFTFDLVGRLKDDYTVTVFDRPGLGYSDRVPGVETGLFATDAESPLAQAMMLREAALALEITDPVVAGHSFGGIVSYAWAVAGLDEDSPVNAKAVVSFAGVTMPWPGELDPYYRVNGSAFGSVVTIPLISALVPQSMIDDSIEKTFAPQTAPEGYADYIGAGLTLRPDAMRANIRQVNTSRPHVVTLSGRYPELTLPIEVVHGTEDTTVPMAVHPDQAEKILPSMNVLRLQGVGHMPHHAQPGAAVLAINRAAERAGLR